MGKNIVLCSDGTGNSFGRSVSNVARMIRLLALDDRSRQVAIYDQGIGTDARRWKEIVDFRDTIADAEALRVLRGPHESWFRPAEYLALARGLATGHGLATNVQQMYRTLAELWEEGDAVFLFGFSRGAFTVRALAGLMFRCGLPRPGRADFEPLFDRAWRLFVPMRPLETETEAFRATERQRACPIQFLGLWDTVKAYGGVRPVMLPHLRHNPIVARVRHALALDEQRGWFDATTWGGLDQDRQPGAAWSRLSGDVRRCVDDQDIEEVWFRGCHSDIGGGDEEAGTARIALRWMLGEAAHAGLRLNADGVCALQPSPVPERAEIHESRTRAWRLVEWWPRETIDNSGAWPTTTAPPARSAPRHPGDLVRQGRMTVHESVGMTAGPGVKVVHTRTVNPSSPLPPIRAWSTACTAASSRPRSADGPRTPSPRG